MKTLIVEDDFTARLLLQNVLSKYGECHIAVNGKEAVEAFHVASVGGCPYDLVCMDILLPEMDGHAAVKQIRALERERGILPTAGAKIIMTTAVNEEEDVTQSVQECSNAYLLKPTNVAKLLG